jgi:hypothetical protein
MLKTFATALVAIGLLASPAIGSEWMGSFFGYPGLGPNRLDGDFTITMNHGKIRGHAHTYQRAPGGDIISVDRRRFNGNYVNRHGVLSGKIGGVKFDAYRNKGRILGGDRNGGFGFEGNKTKGTNGTGGGKVKGK